MAGKEQDISKFLKDIFATGDEEIHCNEASAQMIQSANANLTHKASQARYPALWQHLAVCPDCAQEYELLLALTGLEATEQLEVPPHIPPLPDGGKPALWKRAQEAITAVFPGFAPELATAVTRGRELLFAPVEMSLLDGRLIVELDMAPHEGNSQQRDLFVTMTSPDDTFAAQLDGITLWLQVNDEGPALYQETLVEGDAVFTQVMPDTYTLRWRVSGHELAVTNIIVP